MIIKAQSGSNGGRLAAYLLKEHKADRDKAELVDLRGFATNDLSAALKSIDLEAENTRCQKPLYHVSLRPDQGEKLTPEQWQDCINKLEHRLGLDDQARAVVMHEHQGEQHLHVVWSRIDRENNKAVELIFDHERCTETAREIEREFGLRELTPAHERTQEPLTRADYEQARRTGRDPAEIREAKDLIREAWEKSDNGTSFENALHDAGLTLAQGDTARAPFVVVDEHGKVYGVARVVGEKTQATRARLDDLDKELLPTVEEAREYQQEQQRQHERAKAEREAEQKEQAPQEQQRQQEQPEQAQQAPIQKPRLRFDLDSQQWTSAPAPVMSPEQFQATEQTRAALREKWQELATQARAPLREKWQELTTQAHATRDQSDQERAAEALESQDPTTRADAAHYVAEQTHAALREEAKPDYRTHAAEVTKARAEGENWQHQHDQDKTAEVLKRDQTRTAQALERATESPDREAQKAKTHTPDREKPAAPHVGRAAAAIGDKILDVAGDLLGGLGGPTTHEQIRQQAAGTQQRTAQQVQDAAAQIRQPLTPQEREAKAKEFDRAAKEATRARDAYKDAAANATGAEKSAAMRRMWSQNIQAKEAAKQAALLRETAQQREERQEKEREEREAERRRRERQRER